jgi:hypothetical protein
MVSNLACRGWAFQQTGQRPSVKSTIALIPSARAGAYDASEEEKSGMYSIQGRGRRNCNGHRSTGSRGGAAPPGYALAIKRTAGAGPEGDHVPRIAPGRRRPRPYSRRSGGRQNGGGRSGNGFARLAEEAQPLDRVRANGNSSIKTRRPLKQATGTILKFLNASVRTYM